ncbi:MAG: hypothetical protein R3C00_12225 [Hyphomonas sp.]|nr:hypothetical protein [Hyphomonas sp.]MCA8904773.1 hypothetical protein [Hyphomonas sp.]MCB9969909.1 hypothetical protein [Hyphomonas sp.]
MARDNLPVQDSQSQMAHQLARCRIAQLALDKQEKTTRALQITFAECLARQNIQPDSKGRTLSPAEVGKRIVYLVTDENALKVLRIIEGLSPHHRGETPFEVVDPMTRAKLTALMEEEDKYLLSFMNLKPGRSIWRGRINQIVSNCEVFGLIDYAETSNRKERPFYGSRTLADILTEVGFSAASTHLAASDADEAPERSAEGE